METKILVIEKDNEYTDLITGTLEKASIPVYSYANAGEALQNMHGINPSVILVNMLTPGLKGLETIKKIHTDPQFKDTPIILLTVMEGKFNEIYTKNYGIVGFLKKPFEGAELMERLGGLISLETGGGTPAMAEEPMLMDSMGGGGFDDAPGGEDEVPGGAADMFADQTSTFDALDDVSISDDIFGDDDGQEDDGFGGGSVDTGFGGGDEIESGDEDVGFKAEETIATEAFGPMGGDTDPFSATISLDAFQQERPARKEPTKKTVPVKKAPKKDEGLGGFDDEAQMDDLLDESPSLQEAQSPAGAAKAAQAGFGGAGGGAMAGARVVDVPTEPQPKEDSKLRKKKRGKGKIAIFAVLIVAVLGVAGWLAFSMLSGPSTDEFADVAVKRPAPAPAPEPASPAAAPAAEAPGATAEPARTAEPQMPEPTAQKAPVSVTPEVSKSEPTKPAASKPSAPTPAEVAPATPEAGYYVQFGAFGAEANALKKVKELEGEGLDVKTVKAGGLHRVVLKTRYASKAEASAKVKGIKSQYAIDAAVYQLKK